MTDRTPASPVERARDDVIRSAYGRCWTPICPSKHVDDALDCLEAALDRYAAALQAQDHTITKGGLDVERLGNPVSPMSVGGERHTHTPECRCLFEACVAWWAHTHGGFPGGCDDSADLDGPPRIFTDPDPEPDAVRDYNGAVLP